MKMNDKELKVDRTIVTVTDLGHNDEDQYWWSRSPLERLKAIEINRQTVYGYRDKSPRLQRIFEVARR